MKKLLRLSTVFMILILLSGCGFFKNDSPIIDDTPKTYHIYYFEDGINSERKMVTVENDSFYEIPVPTKKGYTFLGYFDAEKGGTMHVNARGQSIQKYNLLSDFFLYGQWEQKTYSILLNTSGGKLDTTKIEVKYDDVVPVLPSHVEKEGFDFIGWYQLPNGQGKQYTDEKGVFISDNELNDKNFTLVEQSIILYAHFQKKVYKVIFYLGIEVASKYVEVEIEHGEAIETYFPSDLVNGQHVLSWSTRKSDPQLLGVVTGKVTQDYVLYPAEFAVTILFETGNGVPIEPIFERRGSTIMLPIAQWENNKFNGWYDQEGQKYTTSIVLSENMTLTARYMPVISFSNTKDIAVSPIVKNGGENIELPILEDPNFIFVGWYTMSGKKFEDIIMPQEGLVLYAKWQENVITINFGKIELKNQQTHSEKSPLILGLDIQALRNAGYRYINIKISGSCSGYDSNMNDRGRYFILSDSNGKDIESWAFKVKGFNGVDGKNISLDKFNENALYYLQLVSDQSNAYNEKLVVENIIITITIIK